LLAYILILLELFNFIYFLSHCLKKSRIPSFCNTHTLLFISYKYYLPRMQHTRAIPVAWLSSGLCPNQPKGWIPMIIIINNNYILPAVLLAMSMLLALVQHQLLNINYELTEVLWNEDLGFA